MAAVESSGERQALLAAAIGVAVAAQLSIHADYGAVLPWLALAPGRRGRRGGGRSAHGGRARRPPPCRCRWRAASACCSAAWRCSPAPRSPCSSTHRPPAGAGAAAVARQRRRSAALAVRRWQATPATAVGRAVDGRRDAGAGGAAGARRGWRGVLWIDTLPRAIFGDEPRVGMYLFNAYHDGRIPNFFRMGWNTWPVIGLSMQGLFVPLRGLDITTLRLSSALLGTLGVLVTYLLARELSGPRAALLAALLFAICRTAIDFSRLGIAHAQIFFLEPLALFHLWRAINGGRAVHWWMAGVASAWCLFSYNAGQLVPPLVVRLACCSPRWRGRRACARHWRGAALLGGGLRADAVPLRVLLQRRVPVRAQLGPVHDHGAQPPDHEPGARSLARASAPAAAWEISSDRSGSTWLGFGVLPGSGYNLGYRGGGMLDDVSAALFVLGLAMALRRLRRGRDAFVPYWWLATVVAGGIATADPPATVRMVGLLPAHRHPRRAAARVADRHRRRRLAARRRPRRRWPSSSSAPAPINWRTYFVDFAGIIGDPNSELARYLHTRPPDQHALLLGPEHSPGAATRAVPHRVPRPHRRRDRRRPGAAPAPTGRRAAHAGPRPDPGDAGRVHPLALSRRGGRARSAIPTARLFFRAVDLTPDEVRPRTGLALDRHPRRRRWRRATDPFAPLPAERRDRRTSALERPDLLAVAIARSGSSCWRAGADHRADRRRAAGRPPTAARRR